MARSYSTISIGAVFGRLTVTKTDIKRADGRRVIDCECSCGGTKQAQPSNLLRGVIKSCGCLKHGWSSTTEYKAWVEMKRRCELGGRHSASYSERGIGVCSEWCDSFPAFLVSMGLKPTPSYTLGRIDNDKGYHPGNVRWELPVQQNRNKRDTRLITIGSVTKCMSDVAASYGIKVCTFWWRLHNGWPLEEALTRKPSFKSRRQRDGGGWEVIKRIDGAARKERVG